MRAAWRRLGIAAILLAILLAAVLVVVHTPWVSRHAGLRAKAWLEEQYQANVEFGRFDYNLLRGSISLSDLSISSKRTPGLPPFLESDAVRLNIAALPTLRQLFTLEGAAIEGLRVRIVIDQSGRTNLPQSRSDQPLKFIPEFLIRSANIRNASLVFEDRREDLTVTLPSWQLDVAGRTAGLQHDLTLRTGRAGTIRYEQRSYSLDNVRLDGNYARDRLDVENLELSSGGSLVRASGSVRGLPDAVFDLRVEPRIDVERAARLARLEGGFDGLLKARLSVEGTVDNVRVRGEIDGDSLSAAGYPPAGLSSTVTWEHNSLRLSGLALRFPDASVRGGALISFDAARRSSADLELKNFELLPLMRFLELPVLLSSRATGSVQAQWPGVEFANVAGQTHFTLAAARTPASRGILPLEGTGSARFGEGGVHASIESAGLPGGHVSGEAAIRRRERLEGALQGRVTDLNRLAAALTAFLGRKEPLSPVELGGEAEFRLDLDGTLREPRLVGTAQSASLRVGNLRDVALNTLLEYVDSSLSIRKASATVSGQAIEVSGNVGFRGPQPELDLEARLQHASLASLLSAFEIQVPAEGALEAAARVRGTFDRLSGDVTVLGTGLSVYGEPMGRLGAEARIEGTRIETTSVVLEKTAGASGSDSLTANLTYDIKSKAYSLEASGKDLRITQLVLPGGTPFQGSFDVSASGTGSIDDPRLKLDVSGSSVVLDNREIGELSANASLEGRNATVRAEAPQLSLGASGEIRLEPPYPARVEIQAVGTDLSLLGVQIANERALQGSVAGTASASGDLERWKDGRVSVLISDLQLRSQEHRIRNEGPVRASFGEGLVRVHQAAMVSDNSTLRLEGTLPVTEDAAGGRLGISGQLDLGQIYPFFPSPPGFYVDGRMQVDAALQGKLRRLELVGTMSMSDGFLHLPDIRMPFTDIALALRMHDGLIELEQANAQWASAALEVSGRIPLELLPEPPVAGFVRAKGPARFSAAVRNLELASTAELPSGVGGMIDIRMEGQIRGADLSGLEASATFDSLNLHVSNYVLEQQHPTVVHVRDGVARLSDLALTGPETRLQVSGTAQLTGDRALDVRLSGATDAGVLTFLSEDVRAAGPLQLEVAVGGTLNNPRTAGTIALQDGQVSLAEAGIGIEDLDANLQLSPGQIIIEQLRGALNGGSLEARGTVAYAGAEITQVNVDLGVENAFFNIPEGLQTLVNADLTVRAADRPIVIGGTVTVAEGSYTEPFNLESELMQQLRSGEVVQLGQERNPLLERLRFDVQIRTQGPVAVDNNLAEIAARSDLRLVGSYYRPALLGRVTLEEGGAIYLNERKYLVERGSIFFTNPTRIDPSLDIHATTQASGYEIELDLSGPPRDLESTLSSNPSLSEPDIVSVLLTGRTLEETRGAELEIAREQALSLIAGTAGTRISQTAEQALGLSTIRIEPSLIAAESDPGARLTVGQDITRDLRLIYSVDLADAGNQIWVTEYDITRRFTGRGIKQEDNSYRMEFRHDLRFGGPPDAGRPERRPVPRREIGRVRFQDAGAFGDAALQNRLKLDPGDRYDFFKLREGRERLSNFLVDQGRLESRIFMERDQKNGTIDLTFRIQPGPEVIFQYEGYPVSGGVREQVRETWHRGVFDAQRAADAVQVIREPLVEEGYLQSSVTYDVRESQSSKSVLFRISPGTRFTGVELELSGVPAQKASQLKSQLDAADLELAVYTNPARVVDFLSGLLRRDGYMEAEVGSPEVQLDAARATGRVSIPIRTGPLFTLEPPEFSGNEALSDTMLRGAVHLAPGATYSSQEVVDALDRLETFYRRYGYNDAVISHRTTLNRDTATARVEFRIEERRKGVIEEITIEGNAQSSDEFVRRQLTFREGDILDFEKIGASRRNLYQTGVFTMVDIATETVEKPASALEDRVNPVRVALRLREIRPYRVLYGGFYDTDRGPGAIADASHRNFLGRAITLGLRTRYDSDLHEARMYLSQPSAFGIRLRSSATAFLRRQYQPDFITDRTGFSLFQEKRLWREFLLTYGYSYERTHTFDRAPDELLPFDVRVPIARLTGTVTRDSRDDLLDATRGEFNSHALEYAPELLGSDVRFIKYLGQYFRYVPLRQPRPTLEGRVERPRLVYAGAMRVGLAKGFGQEIVRSERFFAGGGTTVRGFEQDQIGPQIGGIPQGGEALFLFNNEIRFPMFSIFDGVGFVDLGNVYPRVSDFNPFEVRKSAGFGLRVRTPFFLLRFDLGFKLDRKPEESFGEFFFSIGQAF